MPSALANAYLQVIPSTKGLTKGIRDAMNDGSAGAAGKSYGSTLANTIKSTISIAAIGKFVKDTLTEGADLQQSLGGVETMFGASAQRVIDAANNAYKTAGLSANEYMETVTGFSASLLQSLGGDTEAAASTADMALTDMADNANKFGSDMSSIQYAYQGFAKQNYTMLDNLKLGYGGTKGEMERLLADAQQLTGVKYNLDNLDDVYNAIHAIQEEMGVTGTTAKEASSTFTGSLAAMQSAAKNVLANLALGEDITPSLEALGETVTTFITENFIPMVSNVGLGLAKAAPGMIKALVGGIVDNLPMVLDSAGKIILALAEGLVDAIPDMVKRLPEILKAVITFFVDNLPEVVALGVKLIASLAGGLIKALPELLMQIPKIIDRIVLAFGELVTAAWNLGENLVTGIWEGIYNMSGWLWDQLCDWTSSLVDYICDLLGIHSPSTVMENRVGVNLAKGVGKGWVSGIAEVKKTMANSLADFFGSPVISVVLASLRGGERIGGISTGIAGGYRIDNLNVTFETIEELSAVLEWLKNFTRTSRMKGETT